MTIHPQTNVHATSKQLATLKAIETQCYTKINGSPWFLSKEDIDGLFEIRNATGLEYNVATGKFTAWTEDD